jgi:hypothetical protein
MIFNGNEDSMILTDKNEIVGLMSCCCASRRSNSPGIASVSPSGSSSTLLGSFTVDGFPLSLRIMLEEGTKWRLSMIPVSIWMKIEKTNNDTRILDKLDCTIG